MYEQWGERLYKVAFQLDTKGQCVTLLGLNDGAKRIQTLFLDKYFFIAYIRENICLEANFEGNPQLSSMF